MKRLPTAALLLVLTAIPVSALTQMSSAMGQGQPMADTAPQDGMDGMEGMGETQAQPVPVKKAAPAGMKGMSAKTDKPAMPVQPVPAVAEPSTMGGMPATPSNQGMAMAPEPAQAGEMEDASHGASANGGRVLWIFLALNAGIIAIAAFLKSKRTFAQSSSEVKP
jgi:hypothetical protein